MSTGMQGSQSQPVLRQGFAAPAASPATESAAPASEPSAPAPEPATVLTSQPTGILRSGEKQATTLEALKNPNSRTYYHRVPGAKFIMPNGLELQFLGGQLVTDDVDIIAELDKVKDKATSMIFTQKASIRAATAQEDAAAADASHTEGVDGKQG